MSEDLASVALTWLEAITRRDRDALFALSDEAIVIVGPRGEASGLDVLGMWFANVQARIRPHAVHQDGERVLVTHTMQWLADDGTVTGSVRNASLFTIRAGKVARYERDDQDDAAARHGFSGSGTPVMLSSKMISFPAIDLKDGQCVRLKLGDMDQATVFNDDPVAQAKAFEEQGFEFLHMVDLNGAFAGASVNGAAVEAILEAVEFPVQLGGGIRSIAQIEAWLEKGLARVILGTVAVRDPELVREACRLFPGRVAVGIDARGGKVAVEGWAETSELAVVELARRFEGAGVAAIIYTDIDRDGVLTGINWDSTLELARTTSIPVIASGGLSGMEDIHRMTEPEMQILEGAISGRAIYDGRIDLREALALLKGAAA